MSECQKKHGEVELVNSEFRLNGEPQFIYSGEIHYFRIPRKDWEKRLIQAKEVGLNTIASYIPWIWHEPKEGVFDFTGKGNAQKDLIGFLELLKKLDLYFIARPGPICNGEMILEGIPTWLAEGYPSVHLKQQNGKPVTFAMLPAFMGPVFQDFVTKWYGKVIPLIKEYQFNQGGPIIAVQLDNEIGMWNWLIKAADYSSTTTRIYQEYLKEKYASIEKLNKTYNSNYKDFKKVLQPNNEVDVKNMIRYFDWAFFYREYYAMYFKSLADRVENEKLRLPLIANIYHFYDYGTNARGTQGLMTTLMFREFSKFVPEVIFGGAYQMRRLDFENFHDIALVTEVVKAITKPGVPSICAELQVGVMNDKPRLYPTDVELNIKTSLAHELNGINCYLFTGGNNPKELAARGRYHEWQAPITSEGKERLHIKPLKLFGKFVETFGKLIPQAKKKSDIAFGFYFPYYATEYLKGAFVDDITQKRDKYFFDGTARLLQLAGFNYTLIDIQKISEEELSNIPQLWLFSLDFMDKETQRKLVEYVKGGGCLILNPSVPNKDLNLKKSTILQDELGIKILGHLNHNLVKMHDGEYVAGDGGMDIFDAKDCTAVTKTVKGEASTILRKVGNGKVLVIGFGMSHIFDYQIDMIRDYAFLMGVKQSILVEPCDVQCVLRSTKDFGFLFLSNYHDEPREATVKLTLPGEAKNIKIPSKGKISLPNRSLWILPLNVPLTDEIKMKYSTVEILEYKVSKNKLSLMYHGARDGSGEILLEIKRPKKVSLNNKKIPFKYQDNLCKIEIATNGDVETLLISM